MPADKNEKEGKYEEDHGGGIRSGTMVENPASHGAPSFASLNYPVPILWLLRPLRGQVAADATKKLIESKLGGYNTRGPILADRHGLRASDKTSPTFHNHERAHGHRPQRTPLSPPSGAS